MYRPLYILFRGTKRRRIVVELKMEPVGTQGGSSATEPEV